MSAPPRVRVVAVAVLVHGGVPACAAEPAMGMADEGADEVDAGDADDPAPHWEPQSPPDYETAHLRIWVFGPEPLCAGQVAQLESEAVRLSEEMGLGFSTFGKLRIAWGTAAGEELCDYSFPVHGCANGKGTDAYVATDGASASHELVHGIRNSNELQTHAFFEEGLAEHLGAERPNGVFHTWRPPDLEAYGPTSLLELGADDFYAGDSVYGDFYTLAAHYVTYLRETHGTDALMAFLRDAGDEGTDELFLDAFGLSLAESEAQWRQDSPKSYDLGDPCHEMLELGADGIDIEQTLACDRDDAAGPHADGSMSSRRGYCFDLAEPTTVRAVRDADDGWVSLVARGCWDTSGDAEAGGTSLTSSEKTYHLGGCRWQLALTAWTPGTSVRVRIEPVE